MTGFTIDDVRETMGPDITSRLAHIELTARAVLLSPPLARSIENGSPPPRFRAIADASHAIFGTSSLVHADSLSSTAQVLERLAEQAESSSMSNDMPHLRAASPGCSKRRPPRCGPCSPSNSRLKATRPSG